jgi:hypothetical protein
MSALEEKARQGRGINRRSAEGKSPPKEVPKTVQMELFSSFFQTAECGELSNTIELWDAIPKFYVDKHEQNRLRTKEGFLPTLKRSFRIRPSVPLESGKGVECGVVIAPAPIPQKDGSDKAFYPAEKEELVESVLRKFFEDQRLGMYDRAEGNSWVRFSLSAIKKELANRGHTASHEQIKESIDILSNCIVTFYLEGEEVYRDPIISSLTRVSRAAYENDGTALWACRFPALISYAIEDGRYMQYDYGLGMQLKTGLSRWLHQLLSRRWKHAGGDFWYDLKLSVVERDSGYLDYGQFKDKRRKFERTIDELINADVIKPDHEMRPVKDGRKIVNIEYRFWATESFRNKMKAGNKRLAHNLKMLQAVQAEG